MNKLTVKIILALAIGVLVGTVAGNLENNKEGAYFHVAFKEEISEEAYEMFMKKFKDNGSSNDHIIRVLRKKESFNKELGFYYGSITSSSLIILFLIPALIKKDED